MISVLLFLNNKDLEKSLQEGLRAKGNDKANALGLVVEQITKGVFEGKGEATTASGKADIQGIPASTVKSLIAKVEGSQSPTTESLVDLVRGEMGVTFDVEAKGTEKLLGGTKGAMGTLKVSQATPTVTKTDADYVKRAEVLITEIVRLGLGNPKLASSISAKFQELKKITEDKYANEDIKTIQAEIQKMVGGQDVINNAYQKVMNEHFDEFMSGPFGAKLKSKGTNLTVQVNAKAPGAKNITFFQTFFGLKFTNSDFTKKKDGNTYKFYFSSSFEQKLLKETRKKLEQNAILSVKKIDRLGYAAGAKTELGAILKGVTSIDQLKFSVNVPSGGSIDLNFGIDAGTLLNSISTNLPRSLTPKRTKVKTGQFISAVTMTKLLQDVTKSRMRKGGEPTPPTLTYRSGRFIENLRVAQVNYRNSIIRYYSNPIYYSLEQYGYDVSEMIEGSLRSITQNLYSRQFKLIRGDI